VHVNVDVDVVVHVLVDGGCVVRGFSSHNHRRQMRGNWKLQSKTSKASKLPGPCGPCASRRGSLLLRSRKNTGTLPNSLISSRGLAPLPANLCVSVGQVDFFKRIVALDKRFCFLHITQAQVGEVPSSKSFRYSQEALWTVL
jgi:hypothetical protein